MIWLNTVDINLNRNAIAEEYRILHMENTEAGKPPFVWNAFKNMGALPLGISAHMDEDEAGRFWNARALFPRNVFPTLEALRAAGRKIASSFPTLKRKVETDLDRISDPRLLALFLNALPADRFTLSSINGTLHSVDPSRRPGRGAIAVHQINIDSQARLQVHTRTFRHLATFPEHQRSYLKGKYNCHAVQNGMLVRLADVAAVPDKEIFIQKGLPEKKAHCPYLHLSQPDKTGHQRALLAHFVLQSLNRRFGRFLKLTFRSVSNATCRPLSPAHTLPKPSAPALTLVDRRPNPEPTLLRTLKEGLQQVLPGTPVHPADQPRPDSLNFILLDTPESYQRKKLPDPYQQGTDGFITQHIHPESLKSTAPWLFRILLREATIKEELHQGRLHASRPRPHYPWRFILPDSPQSPAPLDLRLQPDGSFSITAPTDPRQLAEIEDLLAEAASLPGVDPSDQLQGLVGCQGHLNAIFRTSGCALPDPTVLDLFQCLRNPLPEHWQNGQIIAAELQRERFPDPSPRAAALLHALASLPKQPLDRKALGTVLRQHLGARSREAQQVRQFLHQKYQILFAIPKARAFVNDTFTGMVNVHCWQIHQQGFYLVGLPDSGLQHGFDHATVLRKLLPLQNAPLLLHDLLPFLTVDFVRSKAPGTVLPFPFKYLREFAGMGKHGFQSNYLQIEDAAQQRRDGASPPEGSRKAGAHWAP